MLQTKVELKKDTTIKEMSIILNISQETVRKRILELFNFKTVKETRAYVKSKY